MSLEDYKVSLDAFEGPLDLLLYLIRRDEIDIHDIPVARITGSYLAFLEGEGGIDRIDVDLAAEFLVMAATLMEIKSRMLSPDETTQNAQADGPLVKPEDPRADLVRQLLAYKRFRDAAAALEHRHHQWSSRFGAAAAAWEAAPVDEDEQIHLEDVSVVDLCEAFAMIMEAVDFTRLGQHTVKDDETPIQVHAADIIDLLKHAGDTTAQTDPAGKPVLRGLVFAEVFKERTRSECIGLFLAMLELIRQRQILVTQDTIHGTIVLRLRDEGDDVVENRMKDVEVVVKRGRRRKAEPAAPADTAAGPVSHASHEAE